MAVNITMPKLSDTMEEGTVVRWLISAGDRVTRGAIIAEVETDKAVMEMEAFHDGVVSSLAVEEGATVPVGSVIAVLEGEEKGSKAEPEPEVSAPSSKSPPAETEKDSGSAEEVGLDKEIVEKPPEAPVEKVREQEPGEEKEVLSPPRKGPAISPAARRVARKKGVVLEGLRGSGPEGRIVVADVEAAAAAGAQQKSTSPPEKKSVKIRRIVARKMVESWQSIPHFFVTVAIDMTDVIRFRRDLEVSINDFVLAAAARSLTEHPWVNSHWIDGEAVEQSRVDIAMAVATDRGLFNPVLRDCARMSIARISTLARALAQRAHQGKLTSEDLEGGTFTISNMGMLGVESFSAIITPPQAAVLAVGTVKGEVVVDESGEPGIAPILRATLSADHRILDGADAAEFLATLKSYLEAPVTLVTCREE